MRLHWFTTPRSCMLGVTCEQEEADEVDSFIREARAAAAAKRVVRGTPTKGDEGKEQPFNPFPDAPPNRPELALPDVSSLRDSSQQDAPGSGTLHAPRRGLRFTFHIATARHTVDSSKASDTGEPAGQNIAFIDVPAAEQAPQQDQDDSAAGEAAPESDVNNDDVGPAPESTAGDGNEAESSDEHDPAEDAALWLEFRPTSPLITSRPATAQELQNGTTQGGAMLT